MAPQRGRQQEIGIPALGRGVLAALAVVLVVATSGWSAAAGFRAVRELGPQSDVVTLAQLRLRKAPPKRARNLRRFPPKATRSIGKPARLKSSTIGPTCGVRGKPPCRRPARRVKPAIVAPKDIPCGRPGSRPCPPGRTSAPLIAIPPPPPACGTRGGPQCPGDEAPPRIANPVPPSGGGFDDGYFRSLPRRLEGAVADTGPEFFPRQVLVLLDSTQPTTLEDELAQQHNLQRVTSETLTLIGARAQLYAITDGRAVAAVAALLGADPRVREAQANFRYRRVGERAKPAGLQYAHDLVAPAHELARGRGVLIAVIDTAIDREHPDLHGIIEDTFDAASDMAGEGDGHGTAVAGIIGGQGTVRGVAPLARILAVRAFAAPDNHQPVASSSFIVLRAIEWSVLSGAQVLNMSFVGPRDPAVRAMIEGAQARDALIVAAAGNGGPKAPAAYPAAYPGVVAATAIDASDRRYQHANRGNYIALSAPGVDILAPADGKRHAFVSGTSFAAAHISGIVALLLERGGTIAPQDIVAALTESAVDIGPEGRDVDFGFGRANALAALQALKVTSSRR